MPGHLDGFELAFVRSFGIAGEVGQFCDVAMQVGEADGERIEFGMSFGKQDAEVFGVVPGELLWASSAPRVPSFSVSRFQSNRQTDMETLQRFNFETLFLVFFRNVIPVPRGNFHDDFAGLGDLCLATETRV